MQNGSFTRGEFLVYQVELSKRKKFCIKEIKVLLSGTLFNGSLVEGL